MKLHRSAKDHETKVAAVAAKTNWKNHFDSLYAEKKIKIASLREYKEIGLNMPI